MNRRRRFEILQRFAFTCHYCGRKAPAVELHVDHVHPRSRGGLHEDENLVAACVECNLGKSDWPIEPPQHPRYRYQDVWCELVWEWIGAFKYASVETLPDRERFWPVVERIGKYESVELVLSTHQLHKQFPETPPAELYFVAYERWVAGLEEDP